MNSDSPTASRTDPDCYGWREEGKDILRGVAAGAMVGMPLLYTMEMWWRGMTMGPGHLLLLLGAAFVVNVGFCYFSGFRQSPSLWEAASESTTALGIGFVFSWIVLLLIGAASLRSHLSASLGKVLVETVAVSLGVSFANTQVKGKRRAQGTEKGDGNGGQSQGKDGKQTYDRDESKQQRQAGLLARQLREDLNDVAATISGATVFAFNVAPTEEIIQIAARLPAWQHLLVIAASMVLCYLILFAAEFEERQVFVPSLFQNPMMETIVAYAISLVVALVLLWLIGFPAATTSLLITVKTTIVLGLPAVVGGAAGRLIA